jgi:hypothetical protein
MMKKNEMADVEAKDFVIFKAGTWNGETFTEQDLDNMVNSYNAEEPPHFFLGHSSDYKGKTTIPSWGRITGGLKRTGKELIASGAMFNEQMAKWIKEGFFNQRSVEMTKDNKKIIAVGLLGVMPPAVKNMPLMQEAFKDAALQYSELADSKCIEFMEDETQIENKEKELSEICGRFIESVEPLITDHNLDDEVVKEVIEFQEEITKVLSIKMPEKKTKWQEFADKIKSLFNNRKEIEVEKQQEKEYQDKIALLETEKATLETQNKEFAEKERLANEARAKADKDTAEATLKTEIKTFCDTAVTQNRMTPAMRETNEPIMFEMAKAGLKVPGKDKDGKDIEVPALKVFQEQFAKEIVPLGETQLGNPDNDARPQVIKNAEKYYVSHKGDKEFAGLDKEQGTNRVLFLHTQGKIKFEDK